jgi:hypothetical protein
MSIPAPAGFSGGPLAYDSQPQSLVAIVTTNHDSWAVIDRIEEVAGTALAIERRCAAWCRTASRQ